MNRVWFCEDCEKVVDTELIWANVNGYFGFERICKECQSRNIEFRHRCELCYILSKRGSKSEEVLLE